MTLLLKEKLKKKALELAELFIEKKEEALKYINGKKIQCSLNANKLGKENVIGNLELSITHVRLGNFI